MTRVALAVAPLAPVGGNNIDGLRSPGTQLVSARMASRVAPGIDLALGFRTGGGALRGMTGQGTGDAPFLLAQNSDLLTPEFRPDRAN